MFKSFSPLYSCCAWSAERKGKANYFGKPTPADEFECKFLGPSAAAHPCLRRMTGRRRLEDHALRRMNSATRSAIITTVKFVFALTTRGITEASAT